MWLADVYLLHMKQSRGPLSAGSWLKLSSCTCCALVSMEIRGWLSWMPWVFLIDQLWLWIICCEPHYGVKEPLWEGLTNVRIKTTGPFSLSAVMTGEKIRICNQSNLTVNPFTAGKTSTIAVSSKAFQNVAWIQGFICTFLDWSPA